MTTPLRPFLELKHGPLEKKKIFAFRQDQVQSQLSGREATVDRLFAADWVNVVAFNDDDEILLVRQWRFGSMAFSVELPAGAIDVGEDPVVAGLRELREETGHTPVDPTRVVLLGATRPNPAFMQNRCFTVFVPRARKTHEQSLDPTEEVEVLTLPRSRLDERLRVGATRCASEHDGDRADVADGLQDSIEVLMDNALGLVALHLWKLHVANEGAGAPPKGV